MAAATDARVRCVRADAERLRAKGDYGATLLLASAGADAVRTAVERGDPTYVDGDRKVAATGNAAFVAAAASESGGYGPALGNYGYVQAAWNLTRPPVPVVVAPPPETPPAAGSGGAAAVPPPATATSSAGPSQATVKEAENQVLGVTE